MTKDEALKLALDKKADNARELGLDYEPENTLYWYALNYRTAPTQNAQAMFEALEKFVEAAIKEALAQPEHKCNSHPKAPHGFNRNASHANDRYTCECESWDAYEAGYQAGVTAGIEMSTETEQKPVAWLGFNERGECREVFTPKMKETFPNYPTADMIPVYTTPPQRTWIGLTYEEINDIVHNHDELNGSWELIDMVEAKLRSKNT